MDKENIALVIDSWLTYANSSTPCSDRVAKKNPQNACKATLARGDILLATTGAFIDTEGNSVWGFSANANRLLQTLPKDLSKDDLDQFARNWQEAVIGHFDRKVQIEGIKVLPKTPMNDISTLLVLTRVEEVPYGVRFTAYWDGMKYGVLEYEARLDPIGPTVMFAGSCRDDVIRGGASSPFNKPSPQQSFETQEIRDRRMMARSVGDFVKVGRDYEEVLARESERQNKCYVGPPYDVATWAKSEPSWHTAFKDKCSQ